MRSVLQAWSGLCKVESLKLECKQETAIQRVERYILVGSFRLIVREKYGPGLITSSAKPARKR